MSEQYKKDFLKEVIVRIDIEIPIDNFKDEIPSKLSRLILKDFPISEPKKIIGRELRISGKKISEEEEKFMNWIYFGKNREKKLAIDPKFVFISYREYPSFKKLKEEFSKIVKTIFDLETDIQINRLGLRYINNIYLNEKDFTNWENYINDNLTSLLSFGDNNKKLSRSISMVEYNYENIKFRFQSGMFNPDYPAKIKKKLFLLDYDAYHQGLVEDISELKRLLEDSHSLVKKYFENSIKQGLRSLMNEKK
jgi:uncharacterized protein (TIGR04255 family)